MLPLFSLAGTECRAGAFVASYRLVIFQSGAYSLMPISRANCVGFCVFVCFWCHSASQWKSQPVIEVSCVQIGLYTVHYLPALALLLTELRLSVYFAGKIYLNNKSWNNRKENDCH